jgi:multicomponent Na+:H+ antiporter subunit A
MAVTFATLLAGLGSALIATAPGPIMLETPYLMVKEWGIALLVLAGTGVVVSTNSRITALAGLGVVGVGVALIFITYGAPDVAITQLLVEVLVVVLVALAILKLPSLEPETGRRRWFDAALALGIGGAVTVVMLMVLDVPIDRRLSEYFEVTSWPEAFGRNIVNVILVDFRALDTFGEIAVVAVAGIAAFALLKTKLAPAKEDAR